MDIIATTFDIAMFLSRGLAECDAAASAEVDTRRHAAPG
jgi:hypothetical protein